QWPHHLVAPGSCRNHACGCIRSEVWARWPPVSSPGFLPAAAAALAGGLAAASLASLALAAQAALEQFGEVDHIGALTLLIRLDALHRLDLAGVDLLVDQRHDLVLEGVAVLLRLPASAHVFHQPLGHIQLLVAQVRLARLVLQVKVGNAAYFGWPAQHDQR